MRALFADLAHAGDLGGASPGRILSGEAGREAEGTRVRFTLRVGDSAIIETRYRAYGCPYTLATCEWLARSLEGAPLAALQGSTALMLGGPLDWARTLGVPPEKLGRLLTIEDALHNALRGPTQDTASCSTIAGPEEY